MSMTEPEIHGNDLQSSNPVKLIFKTANNSLAPYFGFGSLTGSSAVFPLMVLLDLLTPSPLARAEKRTS